MKTKPTNAQRNNKERNKNSSGADQFKRRCFEQKSLQHKQQSNKQQRTFSLKALGVAGSALPACAEGECVEIVVLPSPSVSWRPACRQTKMNQKLMESCRSEHREEAQMVFKETQRVLANYGQIRETNELFKQTVKHDGFQWNTTFASKWQEGSIPVQRRRRVCPLCRADQEQLHNTAIQR